MLLEILSRVAADVLPLQAEEQARSTRDARMSGQRLRGFLERGV